MSDEKVGGGDPPQDAEGTSYQGGDPPATDPPMTQSVHAHTDYPTSDDDEIEDEEVIEEEIVTDGEETIEEEIIEEEYTDSSLRSKEASIKESETAAEPAAAAAPAPGLAPIAETSAPLDTQPAPSGRATGLAHATTSPVSKKEPVMDNDLAAFMERRRRAADGEEDEKTEHMANLPDKLPETPHMDEVASIHDEERQGQEVESKPGQDHYDPPQDEEQQPEPEPSSMARTAVPAVAAGAAVGGAAMYYAQHQDDNEPENADRDVESGVQGSPRPYQETDPDDDPSLDPVEDEIGYESDGRGYEDEPPVVATPVQPQSPYQQQQSPYQSQPNPYQQQSPYQQQQSPYQQRSPYQQQSPYQQTPTPVPVTTRDADLGEQPKDTKNEKRATIGPSWALFAICCCIGAVLIAAGIILGILLSDDDGDGETARSLPPIATPRPTPPPVQSGPTVSPTFAPVTIIPMQPGQTITGPSNSGFGASLAASMTQVSAGATNTSAGDLFSYTNRNGEWDLLEQLSGPNDASEFGFSVDMNGLNSMIVGAPGANPPGRNIATGSAFYYSFNPGSDSWVLQGNAIQGGIFSANANERFGESVAISSTNVRAAIGAPQHGGGAGRVYMFELTGGEWTPMDQQELLGRAGGAGLGSAVDISTDGTIVAVGSPGDSGFHIYEWLQGQWTRTLREEGPANSAMGTSVAVLSNEFVVVGMPTANSNRGMIGLYQKTEGAWSLVDSLTGSAGQGIGGKGLLTGTVSADGNPEVTFGTANGRVRRFDFIRGEFAERFTINTALNDLSSVAIVKESDSVVVYAGSSETGEIFEFTQVITPAPTRRRTPEPTTRPTGAPTFTPRPTTETKSPTLRPTTPPTGIPDGSGWVAFSGPFTGPAENVDYGASVTMDGTLMATGSPQFSGGIGAVQTFQKVGTNWEPLNTVFDTSAQSFGQAVDISVGSQRTSMVVGAPRTLDDQGFDLPFGTVHYYELNDSQWSLVGSPLRPDVTPLESNGEYGSTVAVAADIRRIAVGGSSISLDAGNIDNGRVYTYEYNGNAFAPLSVPINGTDIGGRFGRAVAMTNDGSRLLVGAPGSEGSSAGAIYYYRWDETDWRLILPLPGLTENENLGTSVAIIATNGETIAMGAPNFDGGNGAVRVYRRPNANEPFWEQVGEDIVGADGDALGSTLSGTDGTRIVAGTANGSFKVYDFNSGANAWELVDEAPDTGSPVVSIATGSTKDVVVGLDNENVAFYGLF